MLGYYLSGQHYIFCTSK